MYKLLKDSLKIRKIPSSNNFSNTIHIGYIIYFITVYERNVCWYAYRHKECWRGHKIRNNYCWGGIISLFLSYIYNLKIMKVKNNISFEINSRGILHLQKIPLEIEYEPTYMTQRLNSDSRIVVDFLFW